MSSNNSFTYWKEKQIELGNLIVSIHLNCRHNYIGKWKDKYSSTKGRAIYHNIEFTLTFDNYLYKCFEAGLNSPIQIGKKPHNYQLARYKDLGGYNIDNCRFITVLENQNERNEHFDVSKEMKKRVENGNHNFLEIKPWNHYNCTNNSLEVWSKAKECYDWWIKTNKGCRKLLNQFDFKSEIACRNIIKKFKSGWVPNEDKNWINWSTKL